MTTTYNTNNITDTLRGVSVLVIYTDGSSRIYDKIKNSSAYINHLLNYSNDDIVSASVIGDDDFFDWD